MSCSVVDENQCFGGRCCICLQGRRNVGEASSCLQYNGTYLPHYRCHTPEDRNVNTHCCENPKSPVYLHMFMHTYCWHTEHPTSLHQAPSLQFHTFTSAFITSWCPYCCKESRNTFIAHSNASQRSLCDQDWIELAMKAYVSLTVSSEINFQSLWNHTLHEVSIQTIFKQKVMVNANILLIAVCSKLFCKLIWRDVTSVLQD